MGNEVAFIGVDDEYTHGKISVPYLTDDPEGLDTLHKIINADRRVTDVDVQDASAGEISPSDIGEDRALVYSGEKPQGFRRWEPRK